MINKEQFKEMCDFNRTFIEVVFQHEKSFKEEIISKGWGYDLDTFTLERCHLSGSVCRITLLFDDYSTKDVYFDLQEVYSWYEEMYENLMAGRVY